MTTVDGTTTDCGTYAGAQRHWREGSPVCDPCKKARNEYMREWRAQRPGQRDRDRRESAARQRALTRLSHLHRAEFHALFREEMEK